MNSKYNGSVLCKTICMPLKPFPVVCCYGIAWDDMDKNLKKSSQRLKVLMLCLQKVSQKKLLRLVLPDEICLISSYATCTSPTMHLIYPLKVCITFVFHFPWVLQPSQEKLKTMLMQNLEGQIRCIMGNLELAYE